MGGKMAGCPCSNGGFAAGKTCTGATTQKGSRGRRERVVQTADSFGQKCVLVTSAFAHCRIALRMG